MIKIHQKFTPADEYAQNLGAYSYIVQNKKKILHSYGDVQDIFNIASIRKPLLGALIGIRIGKGLIHLNTTLEELGIDDVEPKLTKEEKQATIKDLLQFRSGIFHPANYETASMKEKPVRGSVKPGELWFYNNWDANVLGTIYRQITNHDIFEDFLELIAKPIGMQDFDVTKCEYIKDNASMHPAYIMRMTARDLAKFGLLYLQNGIWTGKQIIPKEWIDESTAAHFRTPKGYGFGYLWNITDKAFGFSGYPGHFLHIDRDADLVVVYEHNLDSSNKTVRNQQFNMFLSHIV